MTYPKLQGVSGKYYQLFSFGLFKSNLCIIIGIVVNEMIKQNLENEFRPLLGRGGEKSFIIPFLSVNRLLERFRFFHQEDFSYSSAGAGLRLCNRQELTLGFLIWEILPRSPQLSPPSKYRCDKPSNISNPESFQTCINHHSVETNLEPNSAEVPSFTWFLEDE